jgi:rhodanese-related sulfurtransferase
MVHAVLEQSGLRKEGNAFVLPAHLLESHGKELASIRAAAEAAQLGYAGDVPPQLVNDIVLLGSGTIVDVRTAAERRTVGFVPDSHFVPWAEGPGMVRNPRFLLDLGKKVSKDDLVFFLCRSGQRSAAAAKAATSAGYKHAFNILGGFEGDKAPEHHGQRPGWKALGLAREIQSSS